MASIPKLTKMLADDSAATFDTNSVSLLCLSNSLQKMTGNIPGEELRGTRSMHVNRVAAGLTPVSGTIVAEPSPTEYNFWWEFILGGTKTGNLIPVAEALTAKAFAEIRVTDNAEKWYQWDGCKAASASFESSTGQKARLTTNIIGTTETDKSAGAFPSVTPDTLNCYIHSQGVLTLGGSVSAGVHSSGTDYRPERVSISIDNQIDPKYRNSLTATDLTAAGRIVTVQFVVPFTTTEFALYAANTTPFAAEWVMTMGNYSLGFVFPALVCEYATPINPGGTSEILLELNCRAYASGTEEEIYVFNDSTA